MARRLRPALALCVLTLALLPACAARPASDCGDVRQITADAPEATAIEGAVVAYLEQQPTLRDYAPIGLEEIRVSATGGWALVQARADRAAEPAIYVVRLDGSQAEVAGVGWAGVTEEIGEIRDDLSRSYPELPPALVTCTRPAEWFTLSGG